MDTKTLVGPAAGAEELIELLEQDGLPITAAFWRTVAEARGWYLVIASPVVDREGKLPVYLRVQAALKQLPDTGIYLDEVVAVGQNDPLVSHLRAAVPAGRRERGPVTTMYLPEDGASATVVQYRLAPATPA